MRIAGVYVRLHFGPGPQRTSLLAVFRADDRRMSTTSSCGNAVARVTIRQPDISPSSFQLIQQLSKVLMLVSI